MQKIFQQLSPAQAFGIGVFLAVIYYFVAYNSGADLEAQTTQFQTQINTGQEEIKKIEKIEKEVVEYKKVKDLVGEKITTILRYIPEQLSSADLMKLISSEARAADTNIMKISDSGGMASSSLKTSFIDEVGVSVQLEGSYTEFLLFLSFLTKVERIVSLQEFSIRSTSDDTSKLSFSGLFTGYKYKGEAPIETK